MKKITTLFAFMMLASFAFTSCDSVSKDAKRLAQIDCELNKLYKDADKNKDKIKELRREAEDLDSKYDKKEKDMTENEKKEFTKKVKRAYEDEKDKCKDKE
jgi:septal ring factor EnvC (AmiA/AmiB activator)